MPYPKFIIGKNKTDEASKGEAGLNFEQPKDSRPFTPEETAKAREIIKREISETPPPAPKETKPLLSAPAYPGAQIPSQPAPPALKSPALQAVENILEEDLHEVFKNLNPADQIRFKQEGELAAKKIELLVNQVKIKVKEILDLIRRWLKIIPGVNRFFLEQEAKIKLDKIMALRTNHNSRGT